MLQKYAYQLSQQLLQLEQQGLRRQRYALQSPQDRTVQINGRRLLNFCSNNYLGLANDERIAEAFKRGIDSWGSGSGSADLVCGHSDAHRELELALAEFTGREQALLFASGYAANVGTINGLLSAGDHVFEDRLNHASLLDGGWISHAKFHRFHHTDYQRLEHILQKHPITGDNRGMIVSDGVFSMDGDCCDLGRLIDLSQEHNCLLMIDDAHGFGVLGEYGQGLVAPQTYTSHQVPVLVGTLGKAFGTAGAFVAGDADMIEILLHKARNYVFSTAMPPALAAATLQSLRIVTAENWRRQHLRELIQRFRRGARELFLSLLPSQTPIQPLMIGDAQRAMAFSQKLEEKGLLVRAIRPPTVPENTSRLRITFTATHTVEDIDKLLNALADVQKELS